MIILLQIKSNLINKTNFLSELVENNCFMNKDNLATAIHMKLFGLNTDENFRLLKETVFMIFNVIYFELILEVTSILFIFFDKYLNLKFKIY